MSEATQKVLKEALSLSPLKRAVLIDALVSSLADRRGEVAAIPAEEVFAEINRV